MLLPSKTKVSAASATNGDSAMRLNMCAICWRDRRPLHYAVMFDPIEAKCAFCGQTNSDGIYVRDQVNKNQTQQITKEKPR